jgi:hypothetical protein
MKQWKSWAADRNFSSYNYEAKLGDNAQGWYAHSMYI